MAEPEHKTLEMRVAELENKLAGVTAGPGAAPGATIPQVCSYCYYCWDCVRSVSVPVSRGIAQQAQMSGGALTPFSGGFSGMGY